MSTNTDKHMMTVVGGEGRRAGGSMMKMCKTAKHLQKVSGYLGLYYTPLSLSSASPLNFSRCWDPRYGMTKKNSQREKRKKEEERKGKDRGRKYTRQAKTLVSSLVLSS